MVMRCPANDEAAVYSPCGREQEARAMNYLYVFFGAGLGGMLRHAVNFAARHWLGTSFPFGTLTVNALGSCLMGLIAGFFALRGHLPQGWQLFLTTGMLGGFTTFSTFSLETALLYQRGELATAVVYIVSSLVFALGGVFLGLAIMRGLMQPGT